MLDVVGDVNQTRLPRRRPELEAFLPADLSCQAASDEVVGGPTQAHAALHRVLARRPQMTRLVPAVAVRHADSVRLLHVGGRPLPIEHFRDKVMEERGLVHEGAADQGVPARHFPEDCSVLHS